MTDILELARKAGFKHASLRSKTLLTSESNLVKLEALLREKFIAELGEPVAEFRFQFSMPQGTKEILCISLIDGIPPLGTQLYALPKDKDEL